MVATGIDSHVRAEAARPFLVAVGNGGVEAVNPIPMPGNGGNTLGGNTLGGNTLGGPTNFGAAPAHGPREGFSLAPFPPAQAPRPDAHAADPIDLHGTEMPAYDMRPGSGNDRRPAIRAEFHRGEPQIVDMTPEQPMQSHAPQPQAGQPGRRPVQTPQGATLFRDPPPSHASQLRASQPETAPVEQAPRSSIFAKVTGLLRRGADPAPLIRTPTGHTSPTQAEGRFDSRAEPRMEPRHDIHMDPPRPTIRQSTGEDAISDVPAFLRRQTSA